MRWVSDTKSSLAVPVCSRAREKMERYGRRSPGTLLKSKPRSR